METLYELVYTLIDTLEEFGCKDVLYYREQADKLLKKEE